MEKIFKKNHVMTSSLRHFTVNENLPISNNARIVNIIASLLWELHDFKKCTFNVASRDPRWRHLKWLQQISPQTTTKSKFWRVFNLPLEGAVAICDVINILFELSTLARHLRPGKQLHNFYHFWVTGHLRFWPVSTGSRCHVRSTTRKKNEDLIFPYPIPQTET